MARIWLTLYPDTFLWMKCNTGIIYNSDNGKSFTFNCLNEIKTLCDTLVESVKLYSVELSKSQLCDSLIKEWISEIEGIEAGCLIEEGEQNKKLISYFPLLRVQEDIDQIKWNHSCNAGGKIIENLHELVFYVNGSVGGSNRYFYQTLYPIKSLKMLDFEYIESFVKKSYNTRLNQVTFVGDIVKYKNIEKLCTWVLGIYFSVHFVLLDEDIRDSIKLFELSNSAQISFTIIINDIPKLQSNYEIYWRFLEKETLFFPVTTEKKLDSILSYIQDAELKNYKVIPIYNGKNRHFFEKFVYMTKDELASIKLSKREIFANMTLNTHSFGKLIIMPDGKVFADVNDSALGSISDPIYDLIYREMTERKAWFRVRDMKPCCDCVYQWLCPSPGNFELVIGRPNLCHVQTT